MWVLVPFVVLTWVLSSWEWLIVEGMWRSSVVFPLSLVLLWWLSPQFTYLHVSKLSSPETFLKIYTKLIWIPNFLKIYTKLIWIPNFLKIYTKLIWIPNFLKIYSKLIWIPNFLKIYTKLIWIPTLSNCCPNWLACLTFSKYIPNSFFQMGQGEGIQRLTLVCGRLCTHILSIDVTLRYVTLSRACFIDVILFHCFMTSARGYQSNKIF